MRIIERGVKPEKRELEVKCDRCKTRFAFEAGEAERHIIRAITETVNFGKSNAQPANIP